ncbi:putative palmitoyl-CoA hydrolase [Helianthus annuus]|nr:putative palmitoyl-CoA hydrolase [Helianthus annuus]
MINRIGVPTSTSVPWPTEIRPVDPKKYTRYTTRPPSISYWLRAKGRLPDDQALHRMWFHRDFRADEWLLYVIDSPTAYNARGFSRGQMFNRKGEVTTS